MSVSTIPAAIDGLVAVAATVAAAADPSTTPGKTVRVIDGPVKHNSQTVIAIAHPQQKNGTAATGQLAISGLAPATDDRESYAIGCYVESWAGGGGYKPLRDACFSLLGALIDAISTDPTLGKSVTRARVVVLDYEPDLTGKGPSVVIPFQVHVDAFRRAA